jgi:hypothetical protein
MPSTHLARIGLSTSIVVLAACASMDRNPRRAADQRGIARRRGRAIEWPTDDWWRRYGDAQLDQLVADDSRAIPRSTRRARGGRARAAAGVARAALLPQVSGNGEVTYQKYSENYIFPPPLAGNWQTDNRLTLDFVYEIDFWNKNGAALQAALSQAEAAGADAQAARIVVTTGIARAYFNLQRLFAQRDVSQAAIQQRDEVVRITNQRFSAGLDTKVEVRQAEAHAGDREDRTRAIRRSHRHRAQPACGARGRGSGTRRGNRRTQGRNASRHDSAVGHSAGHRRAPAGNHCVALARRGRATRCRRGEGAVLSEREYRRICRFHVDQPVAVPYVEQRHRRRRSGNPPCRFSKVARQNANLRGRNAETDLAVSTYNQAVIDAVHDVADAVASIAGLVRAWYRTARARRRRTPTTSP